MADNAVKMPSKVAAFNVIVILLFSGAKRQLSLTFYLVSIADVFPFLRNSIICIHFHSLISCHMLYSFIAITFR